MALEEVNVKEEESILNNLGPVRECLGSEYMLHKPKVGKDGIFSIVTSWAGVELGVKISELSLRKVATTGNRRTLFLEGSTFQNDL